MFSLILPVALSLAALPEAEIDRMAAAAIEKLSLPGLSLGIVKDQQLVYSKDYGKADKAYPIGSVTKVFTATLLMMMRDAGQVRLDDPVSMYLPRGARFPHDDRGAEEITLRHLATHTSGLPRIPVNLKPAEGDPYNNYSEAALLEGLAAVRLDSPIGAVYSYSNLGYGLLGYALARRAGVPYAQLLSKRLFEPLGMSDTRVAEEVTGWRLGVLAPVGAVVSTVGDMARFLALQHRAGLAGGSPVRGGTLTEMQTPQRLVGDKWNVAVGLGWHVSRSELMGDFAWHNGEVARGHSFIAFLPAQKVGVIALTNTNRNIDELGRKLLELVAEPKANPLKKIAEALCGQVAAEPSEELATLFDTGFLKAIPAEKLRAIFQGIHSQRGACKSADVAGQEITFHFGDGAGLGASVMLNAGGKIIYLKFHPLP